MVFGIALGPTEPEYADAKQLIHAVRFLEKG